MRKDLFVVLIVILLLVTACTTMLQPTVETAAEPSVDANVAPPAAPSSVTSEEPEANTENEATDLDILTSHPWQWISFSSSEETFAVDMPARYVLAFGKDGIVEIVTDCNTAIASYGVDGLDAGSLSLAVAPRTTDTCPGESRSSQFLTLLAEADAYSYIEGQIHIELMSNAGMMIFASAQGE